MTLFLILAGCGGDKKPACDVTGGDEVAIYQRGTDLIYSEDPAKIRKGVACMDRLVSIDPSNWAALSSKGWGFLHLGELGAAEAAFRATKALQPDNADVARDLAIALVLEGKLDDAKQEAARARALSPAEPSIQHVARVVDEVLAGKRPPPKALGDVMP